MISCDSPDAALVAMNVQMTQPKTVRVVNKQIYVMNIKHRPYTSTSMYIAIHYNKQGNTTSVFFGKCVGYMGLSKLGNNTR